VTNRASRWHFRSERFRSERFVVGRKLLSKQPNIATCPDTLIGIAAGLDAIVISADEVLIQYGSRSSPSELLRDTHLESTLGLFFARVSREPITLGALLAGFPAEHRASIEILAFDLLQRGILTDVRSSPVEQYLGFMFTGESDLAEKSVSIVGTGPIGARVSHSLLQHGVGRLTLLDNREPDEFWREALPLGLATPEPAKKFEDTTSAVLCSYLLEAGHTGVQYLSESLDALGVESAVSASDLTILALEQPDIRLSYLVNRCSMKTGKPWLLAIIDGNNGAIGPLFLPPETACYNDYRVLSEAASSNTLIDRRYREHVLERGAGSYFPGLPAYADLVSAYASLAAVHFLLRGASFALGRAVSFDFDRMLLDVEDVLKLPRCPLCGSQRAPYQPPFSADVVTKTDRVPERR
jgi:bacteriocin biosynthesis cyclodehydratase domain-containing protein